MAQFDEAIPVILKHEGGYVNHPSDPGGETNFGIAKRSYPQVDIKNLTRDKAIAIYRKDWWDKYHYGAILDQLVATKIFDMAVNMGAKQAHRLAQRACNKLYGAEVLAVDGVLGPQTINSINRLPAGQLLTALRELMAKFYRELARNKPEMAKFLKGWLNRAAA